MKISDVMTPNPTTVHRDDSVKDAKRRLIENGIKHLPVVDDEGFVVGILTDRDIKMKQAVSNDPLFHDNAVVSELCVANPFCVPPDWEVREVLRGMLKKKIGSTLITDHGKILGIFTTVDGVRVLADLLEVVDR